MLSRLFFDSQRLRLWLFEVGVNNACRSETKLLDRRHVTQDFRIELDKLVRDSIAAARTKWDTIRTLIKEAEATEFSASASLNREFLPSEVPGYPLVESSEVRVDKFVAMVLDMRGSSQRIKELIRTDNKGGVESPLERVFYETSALLPLVCRVVREHKGSTTEYLGDGTLSLFQATENLDQEKNAIRNAFCAAKDSMYSVVSILNPVLSELFDLKPVKIGIGLAISKAVVHVVGHTELRQVKAYGHCIFLASKLSKGQNEIICDSHLKECWPSAKNGPITFKERQFGDLKGYEIHNSKDKLVLT